MKQDILTRFAKFCWNLPSINEFVHQWNHCHLSDVTVSNNFWYIVKSKQLVSKLFSLSFSDLKSGHHSYFIYIYILICMSRFIIDVYTWGGDLAYIYICEYIYIYIYTNSFKGRSVHNFALYIHMYIYICVIHKETYS